MADRYVCLVDGNASRDVEDFAHAEMAQRPPLGRPQLCAQVLYRR